MIESTVSPGLWALAWRRLRRDCVAMVSLVIVCAYLLTVIAASLGWIAADWPREAGVNYAPPGFVGAAAPATVAVANQAPTAVATTEPGIVDHSTQEPWASLRGPEFPACI